MGVTTSWRRPIMHLIPSGTEVHICFLLHSTTYFKQQRTSSYWDLDEHSAWEMNYIVEYQQDKITVKSEQSVWMTCSKPNTSTSSRGWERETATLYVWTQGEAMFRLTIPVHRKWIFLICKTSRTFFFDTLLLLVLLNTACDVSECTRLHWWRAPEQGLQSTGALGSSFSPRAVLCVTDCLGYFWLFSRFSRVKDSSIQMAHR